MKLEQEKLVRTHLSVVGQSAWLLTLMGVGGPSVTLRLQRLRVGVGVSTTVLQLGNEAPFMGWQAGSLSVRRRD